METDVTDDQSSEEKMRRAFETRRGAPFTEEEWDEAKRNLVGLFLMLGMEGPPSDDGPSGAAE
jgi:hypothetical protein